MLKIPKIVTKEKLESLEAKFLPYADETDSVAVIVLDNQEYYFIKSYSGKYVFRPDI